MKKLNLIEVEPLSEQRWSKIERSLVSRLAAEASAEAMRRPRAGFPWGRRAWLVAAALVGVLASAGLLAFSSSERLVAEQPSRITTGASASHLALSGLSLDVEPESAVVVGPETPQGLLIVVDRGTIVCDVAPRPQDAPLIVQAGAARVRVVGTRFSVTRLGESARVKVDEGVVEVSFRGGSARVGAGERWPSEATREPVAEPAVVANDAPRPRPEGSARTASPPPRSASTPVKARTAPEPSLVESASPQKPPAPSRQALFEEATLLERSDPERAARLYANLQSGGDSWAQNALYAWGRLEATRGNRGEARRLLERYLERYPSGSNAEDARAVLTRLR
ncbi:MAG TPA: FecR domain-containing protein [Polyangiaceae bacterium]